MPAEHTRKMRGAPESGCRTIRQVTLVTCCGAPVRKLAALSPPAVLQATISYYAALRPQRRMEPLLSREHTLQKPDVQMFRHFECMLMSCVYGGSRLVGAVGKARGSVMMRVNLQGRLFQCFEGQNHQSRRHGTLRHQPWSSQWGHRGPLCFAWRSCCHVGDGLGIKVFIRER